MTHKELLKLVAESTKGDKQTGTLFKRHGASSWESGGCMAFTQKSDVDILIKPTVKLDHITEEMFRTYVQFLGALHQDYETMLDGENPTLKNPIVALNFGHALLNYQMQVLWRYLWSAPWNVGVICYLYENGFTPAECLLVLGLKMPWNPCSTTPYHIINAGCLVSKGLVIPLLESLGEVSPDTYTINSKFIHHTDDRWIQDAKTNEDRARRIESLKLKNMGKSKELGVDTYFDDLGNLGNIRTWIAKFN